MGRNIDYQGSCAQCSGLLLLYGLSSDVDQISKIVTDLTTKGLLRTEQKESSVYYFVKD